MQERLRQLLPCLWCGLLLTVALIATPAPFATLSKADAGRVVARVLGQEAWASLIVGMLVLWLERARARNRPSVGEESVFSIELMLTLGAVFCTVMGYFGLQPLLPAARSGQGPLSFGQLHGVSVAFFALKLLLVVSLAWRATSPPARR